MKKKHNLQSEEKSINKIIEIIEINYKSDLCDFSKKKSFIWKLHEVRTFDKRLLKELIINICHLIKCNVHHALPYSNEILIKLNFINGYTLKAIKCHFDPKDLLYIKNITRNHYIYTDRLNFAINAYINTDYQSVLEYEDELGKLLEG